MDWFLYDRDLRHERINTYSEAYSEPCRTNKIRFLRKKKLTAFSFQPLTIYAKSSTLDIWQGSEW